MSQPFTLRQALGRTHTPNWNESVLIIVDAQNAYKDSLLALPYIGQTLPYLVEALSTARSKNVPVVHILHKGSTGSPFDPATPLYQPIDEAKPSDGEEIVVKTMADAFAATNLDQVLEKHGRREVVVVGYMTHNCVDATVRSAVHRGYPATVIANACATRDLPKHDGSGEVIRAQDLHHAVLSGLADAIATVVSSAKEII